ncbi:hypothetical protein [Candidatus Liberibacter sp.]|nr:hypothetical protein [Candidatus Liberibacter sp.]
MHSVFFNLIEIFQPVVTLVVSVVIPLFIKNLAQPLTNFFKINR